MPSEPIISVSGLRGIIGESLTPDLAVRYTAAFCASLPEGSIVVTRDGRPTGAMLSDAICAAVVASGRDCLDAGIAATPTTGILIREHKAAGGIQISASHNPSPYNGMKLFSGEGRIIPAEAGEKVLVAYKNNETAWVEHERIGNVQLISDSLTAHLNKVTATVDLHAIRDKQFKVVLDANHGAGSILGAALLDTLNCQLTILGSEPHGHFAHMPEPIAENLIGVTARATTLGADVTFCQDPDADRLAIIDELGNYIGEEATLAICARHILKVAKRENKIGPLVTNCSTSRMTQDIAESFGAPFVHSAVGEANVVDAMIEHKALLGGEGNGGVIDPRVGWVRDSFSGMALVLDAMAAENKTLSQLAEELPKYAIHKSKVPLGRDAVAGAMDQLAAAFSDAAPSKLDGLRLDWPNRWLLVRASNTEPIVRIIAEAKTAHEAKALCDKAENVLK